METLYKTPEAELVDTSTVQQGLPFFVTSIGKMCLLYVATVGIYTLYWGYKHWMSQQGSLGKKISPLWRALFLIFYIFRLCHLINLRLASNQLPAWRYRKVATAFVALELAPIFVGFIDLSQAPIAYIGLSLGVGGALLFPMVAIQRRANSASLDPDASANSGLSFGNFIWLLLGVLMWLNVAGFW